MLQYIKANIGNLHFHNSDTFYDKSSLILRIESFISKFQQHNIISKKVYLKARPDVDFACEMLAHLCNNCQVVIGDSDVGQEDILENNQFQEAALCLSSSGTTGPQKLIVWSFTRLIEKIQKSQNSFCDAELERTACILNLSFGHGLYGCFLLPLLRGQTVVVIENNLENILNLPHILNEQRVSFISLTPHIYEILGQIHAIDEVPSLKRIQSASSPLSVKVFHIMMTLSSSAKKINAYGLTEMMSWVSFHFLSSIEDIQYLSLPKNIKHYLSDDGELFLLGSEGAMATDNVKTLIKENELYYSTNDIVELSDDSKFKILGRSDDLININGVKFYPQEIENFFINEFVEDLSLIVTEVGGNLYAIIEQSNQNNMLQKIKSIARKLPSSKRPKYFIMTENLPRNMRGKILRKEAKNICVN